MSLTRLALLLVFCSSIPARSICQDALLRSDIFFEEENAFRQELADAQRSYMIAQGEQSSDDHIETSSAVFSQELGGETRRLAPMRWEGGHVLSLGSGPDVFRPVFDFPLAAHFHFVDIFLGWGDSPNAVIQELLHRIRALAPGAELTILQQGFLQGMTHAELSNPVLFREQVIQSTKGRVPYIAELRWTSPSLGRVKKTFYLHAVDLRKQGDLTSVMRFVSEGKRIRGVLVSGFRVPRFRRLKQIVLDRIEQGGAFIEAGWRQPSVRVSNYFSYFNRMSRTLRTEYLRYELPAECTDYSIHRPFVFSPPTAWRAVYVFVKR